MARDGARRPQYRLAEKEKKHPTTGSPFDSTRAPLVKQEPLGQVSNQKKIDVSAFSHSKEVCKPKPWSYLKRYAGCGGKGGEEAKSIVARRIETKEEEEALNGLGAKRKGTRRPHREPPNTDFRRFYERADLPVNVDQNGSVPKISWSVAVDRLDYHHYLPLFFDGLRETEYPYRFLAEEGVKDMVSVGGSKILPVIPQLIIPIKRALNTRDPTVIVRVIRVLQALVVADANTDSQGLIGQALVPYYRQILPVFNLFKNVNTNIGDAIDYSQKQNDNLGDLINETLHLFEKYGGDDAFINIKYLVPTYESCAN